MGCHQGPEVLQKGFSMVRTARALRVHPPCCLFPLVLGVKSLQTLAIQREAVFSSPGSNQCYPSADYKVYQGHLEHTQVGHLSAG
jgi:hypothetical protein